MGKILMNGVPFITFVRFSHHQSFVLYSNSVCAAVLQLKLTKLPLLSSGASSPGMFGSSIICHPR